LPEGESRRAVESLPQIHEVIAKDVPDVSRTLIAPAALLSLMALAGCARSGDIVATGVLSTYNPCPPAAIPAPAGDITLFNPAESRDASAIDVVATITNLRGSCVANAGRLVTSASFEVYAQRRNNRGARQVVLPYFATVVQGGTNIVSKRRGRVVLNFADGSFRAQAASTASSSVNASAATCRGCPPAITRAAGGRSECRADPCRSRVRRRWSGRVRAAGGFELPPTSALQRTR
jgi:hypothetical protein